MKKMIFFALCALAAVSVLGCNANRAISFDNRDPLALVPGIEWAVVKEPYAAFRKESSFASAVRSEARRGEIYEVAGKKVVVNGKDAPEATTVWYQFDQGWLCESDVTVYDNKMRATTAAAALKK